MTPITYLKGDATSPQAKGNKVIAHICNDIGGWGKGFVLAISNRWPSPESQYRLWHRNRAQNNFALGQSQFVPVTPYITIANMIGQRGVKTGSHGPPIRYDAVAQCLQEVVSYTASINGSLHMPRIGCGLAGGKWERIEPLILDALNNNPIPVYIYDY